VLHLEIGAGAKSQRRITSLNHPTSYAVELMRLFLFNTGTGTDFPELEFKKLNGFTKLISTVASENYRFGPADKELQ
jgi:hypothetical protein